MPNEVEYRKEELSASEDKIFEDEWDRFVTRHFKQREAVDIFQDNRDQIKEACRIAKYQLESPFGGANAGTNEFGWMPIMPNFILATTTPTYATGTWVQYLTTANVSSRWIAWLGSSSSKIKLSKYATMIMIAVHEPEEVAKVGGLVANIKGKDYPIWYFDDVMMEQDYKVFELPAPIVVEKEQEFYIRQLVMRAGRSQLRPLGVYFAKGDHMRDESAYAKI